MISPASEAARLRGDAVPVPRPRDSTVLPRLDGEPTYGAEFWFTYGANLCLTAANSVLFRYGDFVAFAHGTELTLGLIVGVGMIGSVLMRAVQGIGIDVYGARRIWLLSNIGFVLSCLGHLFVTDIDGPAVFALRILYQTSVAGFFGASITYISRRSPVVRMAEVVGTLGTSGFVGMVVGSFLVDQLFAGGPVDRGDIDRMFLAAAALGVVSGVLALAATRRHERPIKHRQLPLAWLLRRYHPGAILLVGIAMGFGLALPSTFLRPFTASIGIQGIGAFFSVYAVTAFVTRLSIRRMPEKAGIRPMVLLGMTCLCGAMLLYLPVHNQLELMLPAVVVGIAHALLFPAVIAGGSAVFPTRYRGLGTTLMLAMFDLGNLIGAPTAGAILRYASVAQLPKYPTMFLSVAAILAAVGLVYALSSRGATMGRNARHASGAAQRSAARQRRHRKLIARH